MEPQVAFILQQNRTRNRAGLLRTDKNYWEILCNEVLPIFYIKSDTFGLKVS